MQTINKPRTAIQQTWDNTAFFSSTEDPQIASTVEALKADIGKIEADCQFFSAIAPTAETLDPSKYAELIDQISAIHQHRCTLSEKLSNVSTYISTALSVDTQDAAAKSWKPILQKLGGDLTEALTPLNVFLIRTSEDFIAALLQNPELSELAFYLQHARKLKDQLLSVPEEQLITALATSGLHTLSLIHI